MGGQSAQLDPQAHKKSKKVFTRVLLKQQKQTSPSGPGAGRRVDGQTARGVGVGWGAGRLRWGCGCLQNSLSVCRHHQEKLMG